ncbi:MAG TPA: hypothetical protein VJU87_09270, partial [Gemmatimonadaceae bacterium]|nr:hypothetical protein [Gemmatimonadaceae bacterium]
LRRGMRDWHRDGDGAGDDEQSSEHGSSSMSGAAPRGERRESGLNYCTNSAVSKGRARTGEVTERPE